MANPRKRVPENVAGDFLVEGWIMARNILRTGKQTRPKTVVKGKRYRCAKCRKRSPKPVKTPAPWYCPHCRIQKDASASE